MKVAGNRTLAPEGIKLTDPSFRHCKGRDAIRAGIREAETTGLAGSMVLAALLSETLPRLVNAYGPADASRILTRIARDIRTGAAPNSWRQ